jgi:hypothetical protein
MPRKLTAKIILSCVATVALMSGFEGRELFAKQKVGQGKQAKTEEYYREMSKPRGELYKAAKKERKEHVVLSFVPDRSVLAPNLRQLSRRSTDVIIGRVLENHSSLNDEGDEIHKFLTVFVQQVFKGTVIGAGTITIRQLGGSWRYSDGLVVTWMPVGEVIAIDGNSYVFFLNKSEDAETDEDADCYLPTLGAQGVFELDFELDAIAPTDLNKRDPVVGKYKNIPMADFFDEIESVVGEEVVGF